MSKAEQMPVSPVRALRMWRLGIGSWRRPGFITQLVLGLVLLNVLMVVLAVWLLYQSRLQHEESAAIEARNLTQLVDHDIAAILRSVDLTLQATAREAELQIASGRPDAQALNAYIERQLFQHPELEGLRIADAQGVLTHGTRVVPGAGATVADRDYFVRRRGNPQVEKAVSQPMLGRLSQTWVFNLARPLKHPDGSFAGVVTGAIPLKLFTDTFAALVLGPGATFTLFDNELRIVTRHQDGKSAEALIGTRFGSPALLELVRTGRSEGTYQTQASLDGVQRMFSYRKLQNLPLNISVGLATDDYLAQWRHEVVKIAGLVAVFVLATLMLAWFVYRAWQKQEVAVLALRDANRTLDAERHLNKTIIESSPFAIYTRDRDGIVTLWNQAAEKLFGWRADEIIGKPLLTVPPGKEKETEEIRSKLFGGESVLQLEVQRQKRDGTLFDLSTTLAPLRNAAGEIDSYLAIAADITESKANARQIEFLAYRDLLTGLPNRLLLQDRFTQAAAHADRTGSQIALLFLDLDNFKTINDSLGHAVGDALLKEIAARLGACVRETDTISRQGGDEFLVVLPDLAGADAIMPVLTKIRESLQTPIEFEGHELATSGSIGIAMYPADGRNFETLLKKADTAMYQAKEAGRNSYRFFDEQMNVQAVEQLYLKNGLRWAVVRDEFVLHYQPQIDLATGRAVGAEALIRWNHPERGLIAPGQFIPVAEDSGLIVPMGEWVIHEACRQSMAWQSAGLPALMMAVNLSAVQFKRGDVEATVRHALQETGLNPQLLELELTESILIRDTDKVLASVRRLQALGVKLSIDDFGTGYSSLSYLKRFAVDKLKIDQSFVRDLATDPDDAAIIGAIIQMARSLNLRTIAEGVEDREMLLKLRQFKCDEVQGFYFGRPMPAQAFAAYLWGQNVQKRSAEDSWII